MSNSIGEKFKITSFGSSHGVGVGAIVDGCPANLELTAEDIQKELDKRKPGTSSVTTPRKESDEVKILSGIFEGKTEHLLLELFSIKTNIQKIIPCSKTHHAHPTEITDGWWNTETMTTMVEAEVVEESP